MLLQPDLQPPGGEDIGVEGHLAGGAGGVVQHDAGDGEALPVQEARLRDLLRPQLDQKYIRLRHARSLAFVSRS